MAGFTYYFSKKTFAHIDEWGRISASNCLMRKENGNFCSAKTILPQGDENIPESMLVKSDQIL